MRHGWLSQEWMVRRRANDAVTLRAARFNAETDSLNCSILGPDSVAGTPEFDLYVREIARGITTKAGPRCPHHGRLLILDRDPAGESTGHGTPMPQLVHGGPGRAGGGEELGGMRAVTHFMQRTALQGSPAVIAAPAGGS